MFTAGTAMSPGIGSGTYLITVEIDAMFHFNTNDGFSENGIKSNLKFVLDVDRQPDRPMNGLSDTTNPSGQT